MAENNGSGNVAPLDAAAFDVDTVAAGHARSEPRGFQNVADESGYQIWVKRGFRRG